MRAQPAMRAPTASAQELFSLASRVVRVLWYYCDDYITTECMVTSTPGFEQTECARQPPGPPAPGPRGRADGIPSHHPVA